MSATARRSRTKRTPAVDALTDLVIASFRLNGHFMTAGEELARPVGLTSAWWQVLGAVLSEPLTVSGVAHHMGLTRQSVQRTADLLAQRGFVEYIENPHHKRAKLLTATDAGRVAIDGLAEAQRRWAERVLAQSGVNAKELRVALDTIARLEPALPGMPEPS